MVISRYSSNKLHVPSLEDPSWSDPSKYLYCISWIKIKQENSMNTSIEEQLKYQYVTTFLLYTYVGRYKHLWLIPCYKGVGGYRLQLFKTKKKCLAMRQNVAYLMLACKLYSLYRIFQHLISINTLITTLYGFMLKNMFLKYVCTKNMLLHK